MRMNEPAGATGSPIPAEVIPQLAPAATQIAAAHEEPAPATIGAAPTTRVKALEVLFRGSTVPASHDAPSYAVVMTGHFASYQGPHSHLAKLPRAAVAGAWSSSSTPPPSWGPMPPCMTKTTPACWHSSGRWQS
jgi:hypothetical protein